MPECSVEIEIWKQVEVRKASEPSVSYGGKVSESKVEYAARKPEKAESGRPFHDKLEAKKGEVAKQSPPKPAEKKVSRHHYKNREVPTECFSRDFAGKE